MTPLPDTPHAARDALADALVLLIVTHAVQGGRCPAHATRRALTDLADVCRESAEHFGGHPAGAPATGLLARAADALTRSLSEP